MKQVLIKFSVVILATITLTIFEGYWAMGKYANNISGTCLDCSLKKDLFYFSLFPLIIILPLLLIILKFNINKIVKIIGPSFIVACWWFFINNDIFIDRVSSWSTYSPNEEWSNSISLSFIPVMVCSCLYATIFYFILKYRSTIASHS